MFDHSGPSGFLSCVARVKLIQLALMLKGRSHYVLNTDEQNASFLSTCLMYLLISPRFLPVED